MSSTVSVPVDDLTAVTTPLTDAAALARADAARADAEQRLDPATVEALCRAGLPAHFVPARWGGAESTFAQLLSDVALLAEHCPSAAWCAALWAAHGRFCAYLPEAGQQEIWRHSPRTRIAAAIAPPSGTARRTASGWTLDGTWQPVSAVTHAEWVLLAAAEADTAGPALRVFAVPADRLVIEETWDAVGLRATAGHTVLARDVHVPDHLTLDLAEMLAGRSAPGRSRSHAAPAQLAGGLMFCATAYGAARRALQLWTHWAVTPSGSTGRVRAAAPALATTLATASARIEAAGLLLERAARRADAGTVTGVLVASNQRDAAVAAQMLADAVGELMRGGSHMLDARGELHRMWRDVHTVAAHAVLRVEGAATAFAAAATDGER
ncbi:acyl-CoA dehydrogenase family protein [Streptomyces kunmingensis]|uniref:Acyl-CoA dehydrogenase family protein n=1 Tax=Streptomyces kunmingensis TaxID=68225 RepID=A0ABU6CSR3_9ACTN|nr:acyl-CoA dehydrogenase family protein [Streptomyces kunmingensis]MEB3967067.1 acyl-CoA dehydrogenase family protein [Streptomyces kunmingensis]